MHWSTLKTLLGEPCTLVHLNQILVLLLEFTTRLRAAWRACVGLREHTGELRGAS